MSPRRRKLKIFPFERMVIAELPHFVRSYALALRDYEAHASAVTVFIEDIHIFFGIREALSRIEQQNEEVKALIQKAIEKGDFGGLRSDLLIEAQCLEALLDQGAPSSIQDLLVGAADQLESDIEVLNDRVWERVRSIGYTLYEYLIGSRVHPSIASGA